MHPERRRSLAADEAQTSRTPALFPRRPGGLATALVMVLVLTGATAPAARDVHFIGDSSLAFSGLVSRLPRGREHDAAAADPGVLTDSVPPSTARRMIPELTFAGTDASAVVPSPAPSGIGPMETPTDAQAPSVLTGVAALFRPRPTATPSASSAPAPSPTATPGLRATPAPTATPRPTPATSSVRVASIESLLSALADNSITDIVVANGTYHVSPAGQKQTDSLWIGSRFAGRTNPVTVRAETRGGVTFDGGGANAFGGLSFEQGAHDQVWDGFRFANGQAYNTGVIMFGGYPDLAAPHHITLRHLTILASCTGRATSATSAATDHAIYVSEAAGGPHDLVLEDIIVDGSGNLATAIQFYHSDGSNRNAWNVTVRRLTVKRTQVAIILWDPTLKNIRIDGATITNALRYAVIYEAQGATGIVFANITSTGSGAGMGYYSSQGDKPPGVTFSNNSFH